MSTLISYTTCLDALRDKGGMKKREAERLLAQNVPEPDWLAMKALRITRRRWRHVLVLDYCERVKNGAAPLGKGAPDAD